MIFPWFEYMSLMAAFAVAAVVPGLDFAMVLRQSIAHGRAAALATSAGIASAILVHGTYTILGIGLVISQSILLFNLLKFAGAAYLLWIGIAALRAPAPTTPTLSDDELARTISLPQAYIQGLLTNLLNPKAVVFFVALFSTLVSVHTSGALKGFYVVNMSLMLFLWFAFVSVVFTTRRVRESFFRFGKWFNRMTGATFVALAASIAFTRQH
jgi:RhtB (resistance to homoserine/threonine) family protein